MMSPPSREAVAQVFPMFSVCRLPRRVAAAYHPPQTPFRGGVLLPPAPDRHERQRNPPHRNVLRQELPDVAAALDRAACGPCSPLAFALVGVARAPRRDDP